MKKYYRLQIVCAIFILSSFLVHCSKHRSVIADKGFIDLTNHNFYTDGNVELIGQWQFEYGKFLNAYEMRTISNPEYFSVPGSWKNSTFRNEKLLGTGGATYFLKLRLPASMKDKILGIDANIVDTAYELFINNRSLLKNGKVSLQEGTAAAEWRPLSATLIADGLDLDIVMHVSNFHHARGGFSNAFSLGPNDLIQKEQQRNIALQVFLAGSIFMMGLYHLGLYFLRRKNIAVLYFAIVCLLTTLRIAVTGEFYLAQLWREMPYELQAKFEYLSFYATLPFFALFFAKLFPEEFNTLLIKYLLIVCLLLILTVVFMNARFFSETLMYTQVIALLFSLYGLYAIFRAIRNKRPGAPALLIGLAVIFLAIINDSLVNAKILNSIFIYPLGLFIFFFSQAFLLSQNFSNAFDAVERLTVSLDRSNKSFIRFVPIEFLKLLNRAEVSDIELGDQTEKRMTIMFTDIRSFTTLSETMTPEENFNFLNSYLKRVTPIVQKNYGFIDKYIGDAVMALFPRSADDAVQAALEMQQEIAKYNLYRENQKYMGIRVGIGLHTGNLMLGTIGSQDRLQGTVISDSVNLASRIETLTKKFDADILLSQTTYDEIENKNRFIIEKIAPVQVKGKTANIMIYKALDFSA